MLDSVALLKGEEEFNLISQTQNPPTPLSTKAIWVLSSRHSITQEHINCAHQPINYDPSLGQSSSAEKAECDVNDDFERIKAALEVGRDLVAKRFNIPKEFVRGKFFEKHAPYIIYNGWRSQNIAFNAMRDSLSSLGLVEYPASKIVIFDILEESIHTGTQFRSLAERIKFDPLLQHLSEPESQISIVTSAYHVPRVRRLLTSRVFENPFALDAEITFFAVDREFKRPCVKQDLQGELDRIKLYEERGHIGKPGVSNWYDTQSMRSWTPLSDLVRESEMFPEKVIESTYVGIRNTF